MQNPAAWWIIPSHARSSEDKSSARCWLESRGWKWLTEPPRARPTPEHYTLQRMCKGKPKTIHRTRYFLAPVGKWRHMCANPAVCYGEPMPWPEALRRQSSIDLSAELNRTAKHQLDPRDTGLIRQAARRAGLVR